MNINLIQNLFYYFSKQYKKNLLSTRKEVSKKMSSVMKSPLPNLDEDIHNNVVKMRTNEENRNMADRRIPLYMVDIMYEFLGNMSGFIRKLYYDESEKTLYMYHNDQGFSKEDEDAITEKNSSGNNSQTQGLNGHGIKLSLDRVSSKDKRCVVVSMNTQRKCTIGHFDYTKWVHCNIQNEMSSILQKIEINENDGGSLFIIPFNEEHHQLYMNEKEILRKKALLMLNIKIAENRVQFYWNNELQYINKICPDDGCVTLNIDYGYDSKSEMLNGNHKKPPIICINNYFFLDDSIKTILPSQYIKLGTGTQKQFKPYKIEYQFRSTENLTMRLNSVPKDTTILEENYKDGFLIYINDECIVHKPLIKGLKAQHGIEEKTYGGKPRFSMHINKDSEMYSLTQNKAAVKETNKGEHLQKFVHQVGTQYFTQRKKTNEIVIDSDSDQDSCNDEIQMQDISPRSVSTETTSSTKSLPDIHSNLNMNDDTMNENDDISNQRKKRKDFLTSTKDKALLQYQNNKALIYDNSYNGPDRCPCCDRILKRSHQVAGHIESDDNDGSIDLDNCLIICTRCNNNDTRSIPQMMIEEWGLNHDNTKRVEKCLKLMNKQGKDIIPNKRRELLENQFISQT